MAAENAADGEVEAFDGAVFAKGLKGVLGTGGCETAAGLLEGRDADLIKSYKKYEGRDQDLLYRALNFLPCPVHFS
jgi:hypothetical protein